MLCVLGYSCHGRVGDVAFWRASFNLFLYLHSIWLLAALLDYVVVFNGSEVEQGLLFYGLRRMLLL